MTPKDFTLVCSFKNRYKNVWDLADSADDYLHNDVRFLFVDGGSDYSELKKIRSHLLTPEMFDREIKILECEPNSLVQAWNYGFLHSNTRYIIFASSDVVFYADGCIEYIMGKIKEGCQYILVENHAVFCIDRAALPKMGVFDEGFNNGPHFDCDYMIRASEAGIKIECGPNAWYNHSDTAEESKQRLGEGIEDRLPMNDLHNERWFKEKWKSNWPGWENAPNPLNLPHPPTSIGQVNRLLPEVCPYSLFLTKIEKQYGKD